jgi:MHS family alpha-ketoglutarate permease-like MFS transporter
VALWFKNAGAESGFYWYVTGCAAVSLVVYLRMRETKDVSFMEEKGEMGEQGQKGEPGGRGVEAVGA